MNHRIADQARSLLIKRGRTLLRQRTDHLGAENILLEPRQADPLDLAAAHTEADYLEQLSEVERRELAEVHSALQRIEDGVYGTCQACGGRIAGKRLLAIPWTLYCFDCAREIESTSQPAA